MEILLLLAGLGLILAGASFLTDGSAALAKRLRVPEFIIGLTIVAVGTSTPELVVSVLSAVAGKSDVAIGNVVGSNIFNVFVILGVCALIRPLPLTAGNIRRDIPLGMVVSLLLVALASDSLFSAGGDRPDRPFIDGIGMLALYVLLIGHDLPHGPHRCGSGRKPGQSPRRRAGSMAVMILRRARGLILGGANFLTDGSAAAGRERLGDRP